MTYYPTSENFQDKFNKIYGHIKHHLELAKSAFENNDIEMCTYSLEVVLRGVTILLQKLYKKYGGAPQ